MAGTVSDQRKFGVHWYNFVDGFRDKEQAKRFANGLRAQGYNVRVISHVAPIIGGSRTRYDIYRRRARKQK